MNANETDYYVQVQMDEDNYYLDLEDAAEPAACAFCGAPAADGSDYCSRVCAIDAENN